MNEIFKDIPGWENRYQISTHGRLFSKLRNKILKPAFSTKKYYKYTLSNKSITKNVFAHRLVAICFLDNPENKETVNHKNGIKTDNNVENLEWATVQENNIHALETGLRTTFNLIPPKGINHGHAKLNEEQVKEIRILYSKNEYGYRKLAKQFNVTRENIKSIVTYNTWKDIA